MKLFKKSDRISELEREIQYMSKEFSLEKTTWHNERAYNEAMEKKPLLERLAKAETLAAQLKERLAESPYAQLTDLLKALAVKLPTVNISEISVHPKDK